MKCQGNVKNVEIVDFMQKIVNDDEDRKAIDGFRAVKRRHVEKNRSFLGSKNCGDDFL